MSASERSWLLLQEVGYGEWEEVGRYRGADDAIQAAEKLVPEAVRTVTGAEFLVYEPHGNPIAIVNAAGTFLRRARPAA